MPTKETTTIDGVNLTVLVGVITSPLISRELHDGTIVSTFDLATPLIHGRVSVPISVDGEPDAVAVGSEVCVVGFVRRRFFRAATSVTSRTEVVAQSVVPLRRMAQVRKAVDKGMVDLLEFLDA